MDDAKTPRVTDCTPAQGRSRLQQAKAFVMAADLVISDATNTATPGVAAALDRTKARWLLGYARRMTELSRQVVEA